MSTRQLRGEIENYVDENQNRPSGQWSKNNPDSHGAPKRRLCAEIEGKADGKQYQRYARDKYVKGFGGKMFVCCNGYRLDHDRP